MASRIALLTLLVLATAIAGHADDTPAFKTKTIQGRVVYLAEALKRKFGVESSDDAQERILAIETKDGTLVPLVEDPRGRAFRVDKRLRGMDLELTVRRYEGSPAVQVIRVCELAKDGKYEVDYWCDICSIVMFELKECECCQEPNVLRRSKVDK
ncbi:MAG: hypothetical protein WEH44_03410 [Pirellulaceae bacterium]